jgi:predicted glutamine amidotransferase
MCRLLAYATAGPRTLASLLGEPDLAAFTQLSALHTDGWGTARMAGAALEVETAPDAARQSAAFSIMAQQAATDLALMHLRWATLGLPVAKRNTHPFTDGHVAFAHNGSIEPPQGLEAMIHEKHRPLMQGDTDSERYFLAVLSRLPEDLSGGDALAAAVGSTVTDIAAGFTYSSLNSVLLTPRHIVATCFFDPEAEAKAVEPEYFRLRYRIAPDSVLVGSSGWGTGWQDLPNGHLLVVDRGTLATSVHALHISSAGL